MAGRDPAADSGATVALDGLARARRKGVGGWFEVGEWPPLDDLEMDEDMEEI